MEGFSPALRLRFLYSDVSETAFTLQEQHGNDMQSAGVLACALAGIAIVGIDLGDQDELITLHAEMDDGVLGYLVEMSGRGRLRGYTYLKDPGAPPPPAGEDGRQEDPPGPVHVKLTRAHESGRVRSQMSFAASPPTEMTVFNELYNSSLQVPTCLRLSATFIDGRIDRARALAVQKMPDARKSHFKRVCNLFEDGTVQEQLEIDASLPTLREIFNIPDLMTGPTRALQFGCTCSQAVADRSFASRPKPELEAMARMGRNHEFRCHMCGSVYTVTHESIARFALEAKP